MHLVPDMSKNAGVAECRMAEPPLLKTATFAPVHFGAAFTVAYLLSGSVAVGGAVALIEPLCNTLAFYVHERAWARAGRRRAARRAAAAVR